MIKHIIIPKKYFFFRRDAIKIFKKVIETGETPGNICLDFSGAVFFSRSFVDEFLNVISELKSGGISVTINNLDLRLAKMVDRIEKTKTEIQKAIT